MENWIAKLQGDHQECVGILERAFAGVRALAPKDQVEWLDSLLARLQCDETPGDLLAIVETERRRALFDAKKAKLRELIRKMYRHISFCRSLAHRYPHPSYLKSAWVYGRRVDFVSEALRRMKATGKIDVGMPDFEETLRIIVAEGEVAHE